MEKQYYVYKIINIPTEAVEHVGQSKNLIKRWYQHTKAKPIPGNGFGKFYGRKDVAMLLISTHNSKKEAKQQEKHWQRHYDVEDGTGFLTRKLTMQQVKEIRAKYVPWKYTMDMLAKEYKVVGSTIYSILHNQTYTQE